MTRRRFGLVVWRQTSSRYDGPPLTFGPDWPAPSGETLHAVANPGRWHRRWRVYRARPPYALGYPRLRPRRGSWRTVTVRRPGPGAGYVARGYVGMGPR